MALELTAMEANKLREDCQKRIDRAKALVRLEQNADFKEIFLKHYTEEESARLVRLLAEPSFNMSDKRDVYRDDIKEQMIGIARFNEYMRTVYRIADQSEKTLEDLNNAEIAE